MIDVWSHAFFKSTDVSGGESTDRFIVVLRDPSKTGVKDAYEHAFWTQVPALKASGKKFSFLLTKQSGQLSSQGDFYSYKVLEDRKTSQIIEVRYGNTHTSWSRYEAYEDRIVPLSYRTDGSFLSLVPIFGLLMIAVLVGRRLTKLMRLKLGVA